MLLPYLIIQLIKLRPQSHFDSFQFLILEIIQHSNLSILAPKLSPECVCFSPLPLLPPQCPCFHSEREKNTHSTSSFHSHRHLKIRHSLSDQPRQSPTHHIASETKCFITVPVKSPMCFFVPVQFPYLSRLLDREFFAWNIQSTENM